MVWNEWCKELTLYGSVAARWAFWAATKSCAVWCCETPVGKCGGKYGWWCWKSAARWFPGKPDAEMPWLRRSCNVKRNLIRYEICNGRAFRCTLLHYFLNWSDKLTTHILKSHNQNIEHSLQSINMGDIQEKYIDCFFYVFLLEF